MTPTDPISVPYFSSVALHVAVALGLIVVGLVAVHYLHHRQHGARTLLRKAVTVTFLAPVLLATIFAGGAILFALLAIVMVQSVHEYSVLVGLDKTYSRTLQLYSLGGLVVAATTARSNFFEYPLGLIPVAFAIPIFSQRVVGAYEIAGRVAVGYLFISLPIALVMYIRLAVPWGLQFLVIVGVSTAFADAGAYIVGSRVRGPKLAPAISPMKTWSGALGGLIGAAIGVAISWDASPEGWMLLTAFLVSSCVSTSAVFGDLTESVVKRSFAKKDTGTILPGFGGLLDRFDSFFISIPASFVLISQAFHAHV